MDGDWHGLTQARSKSCTNAAASSLFSLLDSPKTHGFTELGMPPRYGETLLGKLEGQSPQLPSTTPALETLGFSPSGKYILVYTLTGMKADRVGEIFKASKEVQLMDEPCSPVFMGRKPRARLSLEAFTDIHVSPGSQEEPVRETQGVRSLRFISSSF